jgi:PAS domain S-box-containing protein
MSREHRAWRRGLRAVSLFVCVGFAGAADAQTTSLADSGRWARFTTTSGLPSDGVLEVVEAADGVVWAATDAGLAWYDGFQWHPVEPADAPPLRRPFSMVADAEGGLLVAAEDGLYRGDVNGFDRVAFPERDGRWRIGSAVPLAERGVLILAHQLGHDGPNGLLYLETDGRVLPFETSSPVQAGRALRLWRTRRGAVWLNTTEGLYRHEDGQWALQLEAGAEPLAIDDLVENEAGAGIAYGIDRSMLLRWDRGQKPAPEPHPGDRIVAADIAPDGLLFVAYESGRAARRQRGTWAFLNALPPQMRDLHVVRFRAGGDAWLGSSQGLWLRRRSSNHWTGWSHPAGDPRNVVHEILQTRDGSIWAASRAGVQILRPDGTTDSIDRIGSASLGSITGLAEDGAGHVWISSGAGFEGAYRWDGSDWRYFGSAAGLSANVHKIRIDGDGRPWFLGILGETGPSLADPTQEPGAFVYDDGRFERWGLEAGLPSGRVYAFAEATDGAYWFGTAAGLSRWREGQWTHWMAGKALPGRVFAVTVDRSHRVWYGNPDGPHLGFIDDQDQPQKVTAAEGFRGGAVQDLQAGTRGGVWVSTGEALFAMRDGGWSPPIEVEAGLGHPRIWPVLAVGARVYIGTRGGGVSILSLSPELHRPPVVEVATPVVQEDTALIRWQAFTRWGVVPPENVETRYRIDDGPWSEWGTRREVSLSNVVAGDHAFQVQAKGLLGDFDPAGAVQAVVIAPPLFQRPVVAVPIGVLSVALVALVFALAGRTRRHLAALQQSENRFRTLADSSGVAITVIQGDRIRYANRAMEAMGGYSQQELLSMPSLTLLHPDVHELVRERLEARERGDTVQGRDVLKIMNKTGETRWVETRAERVEFDGEPASLVAALDVTDRRLMEEQLRVANERLHLLAGRLLTARETERAGIAREMHDELGQALTSLQLDLAWLERRLPPDATPSAERLRSMRQIVETTMGKVQRMSSSLRPSALDQLGLREAIEWQAEEFSKRTNIPCDLELPSVENLDRERSTVVFRILQEALTNVARHAEASRVTITLKATSESTWLEVGDDGTGISTEDVTSSQSIGLIGMRERAVFWNGLVTIRPGDAGGTVVILELPLRAKDSPPS